jgi:hypothetical protein
MGFDFDFDFDFDFKNNNMEGTPPLRGEPYPTL